MQGERVDLTCAQVGHKSDGRKSRDILAEQVGQSKNQIQRFIRLTELIPELLDMVDEKKIALNPAYELSFLKKEEQVDLLDAMDSEQATPSLSQAQRLKKYSQELETAGYIVRRQLRGANGRITDTEYIIYEQPQPKKLDMLPSDVVSPDTENPDMVKPDTEKPAELNIEKSNTEKSITYCNHGHTGSYTLVTPKGKLYFAQLREMILLVS